MTMDYSHKFSTVDLDAFTREEYCDLYSVIEQVSPGACTLKESLFGSYSIIRAPADMGRSWLVTWMKYSLLHKIFAEALENMPLYINEDSMPLKIVALWRMKIGR